MRNLTRRLHVHLLAVLLGIAASAAALAQDVRGFAGRTTLIMVDAPDCAYCRKWDREVSGSYAKSAEGRKAPLSRIRRGDPRLSGIGGLAYTPTFILIVNGREAGRIVGYAGPDFFWGQLDAIVQRNGLVL
jgi:hypothetical protein